MVKKNTKCPVTRRAVIQRINRRLAPDWRALRTSRGWGATSNLGTHYLLDTYRNEVVDTHVDVEGYARELGALEPWESLVDE